MIDILLTKIAEVLVDMGYLGVFLSSSGLFPAEIVIAIFSATPGSNIWMIALVSSAGALTAALPVYFLGYIFREDVLYKWLNGKGKFLRIETENIEKSKVRIAKHGFVYVYLTRLVPWLRIVASVAAGYIKVNIFQYCIAVFLGTYTYTLIISYLGSEAGNNWEFITVYIKIMERWVIILLIGITLIYILFTGKKKVLSKVRNKT
jgi:membrane protein DedA with SNARE-associated domain